MSNSKYKSCVAGNEVKLLKKNYPLLDGLAGTRMVRVVL